MPTELDIYLTSNIKYLILDFTKGLGKKNILLPYDLRCILKSTILLVEESFSQEIGSDYLLTLVAGMHRDLFEPVIKDILIYPEKYDLLNMLDIVSISFGQRIFLTKIFCIIKDILEHCQCSLSGKKDLITSTLFANNPSHHDFFNEVTSNFNSYFIHMAHEATTNAHIVNDTKHQNTEGKKEFSNIQMNSSHIILPLKDLSNIISFCKLSAAYFDSNNEEQLQTLLLMLDSLPPMEIDPAVASPKGSPQIPRLPPKLEHQSPFGTGSGLAEKLKNLNAKLITPNATPASLRKRLAQPSPFQTHPADHTLNGHFPCSPRGSDTINASGPPFRKLSGLLSPPHGNACPSKKDGFTHVDDGNVNRHNNTFELIVLPLELDESSGPCNGDDSDSVSQWPNYDDVIPKTMTEQEFNLSNPIDSIEANTTTTTSLNGVLKKRTRFSLSNLIQETSNCLPLSNDLYQPDPDQRLPSLYNENGSPFYPATPIDNGDHDELGVKRVVDGEGADSLVVETDVDPDPDDDDDDDDQVDDGIVIAGEGGRDGGVRTGGSGSRSSSRSDDPDRAGEDLNGAVEEEGENASVFGCVSTVGTPPLILSGRESPQSEISLLEVVDGTTRGELLPSSSDPKVSMAERMKQQQRREIHDKFGKFDGVKPIIAPISSAMASGRTQAQDFDENVSLISETWSTEVLASDTEGGTSTQSFPWTLGSGANQRGCLSTPNPFKIASIPESPIASYLNGGAQSSDIGDAGSESAWSTEAHAASEYEGACQESYPLPKTESRLDVLAASNTSPPPACSVFASESCKQQITKQAYLQAGRDRERIYSESCSILTQSVGHSQTKLVYSQNSMSPDPSMVTAKSLTFADNAHSNILTIPEDKTEKVNLSLDSENVTHSSPINQIPPQSSVMDSILSNFDPLATCVVLSSQDNQPNMIPSSSTMTSATFGESSSKFNRMIGDHFKLKPNTPTMSFFKATSFDSPISKVQNFLLPNRFAHPNNGDKMVPPNSIGRLAFETSSSPLSPDYLALDPTSVSSPYPTSVRSESPILAAKSSLMKGFQNLKTKVHYSLQPNQSPSSPDLHGTSLQYKLNVAPKSIDSELPLLNNDGEIDLVKTNSKSLTLTDEYVESLRSPLRILNLRQEFSMVSLPRPDLDLDSVCDTLVSIFSSPLSPISNSYDGTLNSLDSTRLMNGHASASNELAGDNCHFSAPAEDLVTAIGAEIEIRLQYGDIDSASSLRLIAHYLRASPEKADEVQKRLQLILAKKRAYLKYLVKNKAEVLNVRRSLEAKLIAMNRSWNANENLLASLAVQEFLTRHASAIKIFSQEFVNLPTPDEKSDLMADFASKLRSQLLHFFPDASENSSGGVGIPSTSHSFCEAHAHALTNGNRSNQFSPRRPPSLSRNADDSIQRLYTASYSPLMIPMDNDHNLSTPLISFPVIRFNFDPCLECESQCHSNPSSSNEEVERGGEWKLSVLWPHVERHLYTCVFHSAMYPNGDGDQLRDQLFERHIARLASTLAHDHKDLRIPAKNMSHFPWLEARNILTGINVAVAPVDKLCHVIRTCLSVVRSLRHPLSSRDTPPAATTSCSADDVIPVLTYVVLASNPGSLLSNLQFVEHYHFGLRHVTTTGHVTGGEVSYWWTQFRSVVEFIKTMEYEED